MHMITLWAALHHSSMCVGTSAAQLQGAEELEVGRQGVPKSRWVPIWPAWRAVAPIWPGDTRFSSGKWPSRRGELVSAMVTEH